MSLYAIGDIQGCFESFKQLIKKIKFRTDKDILWIAGDMINRGPSSLETLKWLHAHQDNIHAILGNHDLHALAVWHGNKRYRSHKDTFLDILKSPQSTKLLDWLQTLPLMHHDTKQKIIMVHAGIPPQWNIQTLTQQAKKAQQAYQHPQFFKKIYGNYPDSWQSHLTHTQQIRYTINALTRMRYSTTYGNINLNQKHCPTGYEKKTRPWFSHPLKIPQSTRILFGHWSTLRLTRSLNIPYNITPLDYGCVWGGQLCAVKIEALNHVTTQHLQPCPCHSSIH